MCLMSRSVLGSGFSFVFCGVLSREFVLLTRSKNPRQCARAGVRASTCTTFLFFWW